MITPEQVLTARPELLRRWCGLLEYGKVRDMWVWESPDGGYRCLRHRHWGIDTKHGPCALVGDDGSRYSWRPLPDYTQSLDAIWPLQSNVANSPRFAQALIAMDTGVDGWLDEPVSMIYWSPEELARVVCATAETRARAVCLTMLDELNVLLEEDE
jgi:hypothetical protein